MKKYRRTCRINWIAAWHVPGGANNYEKKKSVQIPGLDRGLSLGSLE